MGEVVGTLRTVARRGQPQALEAQEWLQWVVVYQDGTVVEQYDDHGQQASSASISDQGAAQVVAVRRRRQHDEPWAQRVLAVLLVPPRPDMRVELVYRGSLDVAMGGRGQVTQGPRELLMGWRCYDGRGAQLWVVVQPDGVAVTGLDPERPWKDLPGKPQE